jgi:hypothetical protein
MLGLRINDFVVLAISPSRSIFKELRSEIRYSRIGDRIWEMSLHLCRQVKILVVERPIIAPLIFYLSRLLENKS